MRLRIQTAPPLAPLKAWFTPDVVYPNTNASTIGPENEREAEVPKTIADLKRTLCARVQILKLKGDGSGKSRLGAEDTVLSLDGFELLDNMPFVRGGLEGAVRDGDLVVVGLRVNGKGKEEGKGKETETETEKKEELGESRCGRGVGSDSGLVSKGWQLERRRNTGDANGQHGFAKVSVAGSQGSGEHEAAANTVENRNGNKRKLPPAPAFVACPPQPEPSAKRLKPSPAVPNHQEPYQQRGQDMVSQESTANNCKGVTSEHKREDPIDAALLHWAHKFRGSPLSAQARAPEPPKPPPIASSSRVTRMLDRGLDHARDRESEMHRDGIDRLGTNADAGPSKVDWVTDLKMRGYGRPRDSGSKEVGSSNARIPRVTRSRVVIGRMPAGPVVEQDSGTSSLTKRMLAHEMHSVDRPDADADAKPSTMDPDKDKDKNLQSKTRGSGSRLTNFGFMGCAMPITRSRRTIRRAPAGPCRAQSSGSSSSSESSDS